MPIGILVSTDHSYEYRVFDLYSIDDFYHISSNREYANKGIPFYMVQSLPEDYSYRFMSTLRICGLGRTLPVVTSDYQVNAAFLNISNGRIYRNTGTRWYDTGEKIEQYGMFYDTYGYNLYTYDEHGLVLQHKGRQPFFPNYIQRFELRAEDVTDTKSAHCELSEKTNNTIANLNLRKRIVTFNTFLPASFLDDDNDYGGESLIQFQISTNGGKSRRPLFTISTSIIGKNKKSVRFHLNRRYISTRPVPEAANWNEDLLGDEDVDLGEAILGVWDKWEVYVKEGYMKEHNPLMIVKRNGAEVYRSFLPNTYNIKQGSYIRYGIYKSTYKNMKDDKKKRIVYFSDLECDL